jgi:hypothetical protein
MVVSTTEGPRARTSSKRPDVEPQVYSLAVTAAKFGVGYTTFRERMLRDELPVRAFRIGGRWLFRKTEVDRVLLGVKESAEDAA